MNHRILKQYWLGFLFQIRVMQLCSVKPHGNVPSVLLKVGSGCTRSKAKKEARLVERKVCFILEAGNWRGSGWDNHPRTTSG